VLSRRYLTLSQFIIVEGYHSGFKSS